MTRYLLVAALLLFLSGCPGAVEESHLKPNKDSTTAARDAGKVPVPDVSPVDQLQAPPSCQVQYGKYVAKVCKETAKSCVVYFAEAAKSTCNAICGKGGGVCTRAEDNQSKDQCAIYSANPLTCASVVYDGICHCTRGGQPPTPKVDAGTSLPTGTYKVLRKINGYDIVDIRGIIKGGYSIAPKSVTASFFSKQITYGAQVVTVSAVTGWKSGPAAGYLSFRSKLAKDPPQDMSSFAFYHDGTGWVLTLAAAARTRTIEGVYNKKGSGKYVPAGWIEFQKLIPGMTKYYDWAYPWPSTHETINFRAAYKTGNIVSEGIKLRLP